MVPLPVLLEQAWARALPERECASHNEVLRLSDKRSPVKRGRATRRRPLNKRCFALPVFPCRVVTPGKDEAHLWLAAGPWTLAPWGSGRSVALGSAWRGMPPRSSQAFLSHQNSNDAISKFWTHWELIN